MRLALRISDTHSKLTGGPVLVPRRWGHPTMIRLFGSSVAFHVRNGLEMVVAALHQNYRKQCQFPSELELCSAEPRSSIVLIFLRSIILAIGIFSSGSKIP